MSVEMIQIYASELSKFNYADKSKTVLVAGPDLVGVPVVELSEDIDPKTLVGASAKTAPVKITEGSRWLFRSDRTLVESNRGGVFAFLTPQL